MNDERKDKENQSIIYFSNIIYFSKKDVCDQQVVHFLMSSSLVLVKSKVMYVLIQTILIILTGKLVSMVNASWKKHKERTYTYEIEKYI